MCICKKNDRKKASLFCLLSKLSSNYLHFFFADAYVERMKKEISSVEEENSKISAEISGLTDMADRGNNSSLLCYIPCSSWHFSYHWLFCTDLAQLDGDLEALACSLKFIDSGVSLSF